jgi:protein-tyrosine phosphatase
MRMLSVTSFLPSRIRTICPLFSIVLRARIAPGWPHGSLLAALDVPGEVIREEYLATNVFSKSFADKIVKKTSENGFNGEIIRPLLEVRDEYINAALEVIEERYGGMNRFLEVDLQVNAEKLKKIFL